MRIRRVCSRAAPGPLTTAFVSQAGFVPQARLSQAVLMQACLRAARNVVRRARGAARDGAPCRRFAPQRLWIEGRDPPRPLLREGAIFLDARSFSIQILKSCSTSSISTTLPFCPASDGARPPDAAVQRPTRGVATGWRRGCEQLAQRVRYASSSQKALIRFQVKSAHPAPSHVIGTVRTGHSTSHHELGIDLSLERLTETRGHRQCALWIYISLERQIVSLGLAPNRS